MEGDSFGMLLMIMSPSSMRMAWCSSRASNSRAIFSSSGLSGRELQVEYRVSITFFVTMSFCILIVSYIALLYGRNVAVGLKFTK